MRDKLIELIDNNKACDLKCDCYECQYDSEPSCFSPRLADALIANGVTVQQWIPVSESLPKPFVSVLVQMPGEEPCPTVREGYISNKGLWYSGYFEREPGEITHWMPMPEFHGKEKQNVS